LIEASLGGIAVRLPAEFDLNRNARIPALSQQRAEEKHHEDHNYAFHGDASGCG
jgi:hypothetical protein